MARNGFGKALEMIDEIEITVTGRKSGRRHSNPVWFVKEGSTVYLVPVRGSDSDWYKNVRKTPTIHLVAEGKELTARAKPVTDAGTVRKVVEALRSKYGSDEVKKYYSKLDTAIEVPIPPSDR